jgi:hypothetical protein
MSMVTVTAITMTIIVMINPHPFYQSNGTMAAINATSTCRLVWHYQLSNETMAFSLSNIEVQ